MEPTAHTWRADCKIRAGDPKSSYCEVTAGDVAILRSDGPVTEEDVANVHLAAAAPAMFAALQQILEDYDDSYDTGMDTEGNLEDEYYKIEKSSLEYAREAVSKANNRRTR